MSTVKKIWVMVLLLGVVTLPAAAPQRPKGVEALMGAAQHQEEVEGNIEAAIAIYKNVIAEVGSNRALAAKAQYHIGLCYEKLGNQEARKSFERVISAYSEQADVVAQARARLAAMRAVSRGPAGLTVRKVWNDAGNRVAVSPDGRFFVFTDWSSKHAHLALRDIASGDTRVLTGKDDDGVYEFAWHAAVSPDAKQVAFAWFNKEYFYDLRVIGVAPGPAKTTGRVVLSDSGLAEVRAYAWSPDQKRILAYLRTKDGMDKIAWVSVADGAVRVVRATKTFAASADAFTLALSPDGRYIVFDSPVQQDSSQTDLFIMNEDGTGETVLVRDAAFDYSPAWTPDGARIVFASDRSSVVGLWSLRVSGGKPEGAPELIKSDTGRMRTVGMTRDGAFYYLVPIGMQNVYTLEIDPEKGTLTKPPRREGESYAGFNAGGAWSPDGRRLAYLSWRAPFLYGPGTHAVVVRDTSTGRETVFRPPLVLGYPWVVEWFPDNRNLLLMAREGEQTGWYRLNTADGTIAQARAPDGKNRGLFAIASDGKTIYWAHPEEKQATSTIYAYDIETRTDREISVLKNFRVSGRALSADGSTFAFSGRDMALKQLVVLTMSLDGSNLRTVMQKDPAGPDALPSGGGNVLGWLPDGHHLLVTSAKGLTIVDVSTGERHAVSLDVGGSCHGLRVHPDGRTVTCFGGPPPGFAEVWVLENFLPKKDVR